MSRPFILTSQDRHQLRGAVMRILEGHRGQANAIRGSQLASELRQPDDRKVRLVIRELIKEGMPIASSVSEPYGFFIVETQDEAVRYIQGIKSRISEDQARLNDFEKAAAAYWELPRQLQMV